MDYNNQDQEVIRETDMDSFVEIEFYDDNSNPTNKVMTAGEAVYGTVHLYAKDNIPDVKQVSITFNGEE